MALAQLIEQLEAIEPNMPPSYTARLLLLLVQACSDSLDELVDEASIVKKLRPIELKMQSAQDQESAVAEELDQLASSHPAEFSPSHVWTLIRALKVQKQIIDLYQKPAFAEAYPTAKLRH